MDLLGSILGGMDSLPQKKTDEETKKRVQEAKLKATKFKEEERKKKAQFRIQIEERINKFIQGPANERKYAFEAMDKLQRSIVHDVAETAGVCSYSFGEEDVDRHLVIWKKEYSPTEAEIQALQNGEEFDPTAIKETVTEKPDDKDTRKTVKLKSHKNLDQEKYFEKYAKIVGDKSGINAAAIAQSNKSYGMVPSKNKTDKRSIEETMKDIRERKKLKLSNRDEATDEKVIKET